MKLVGFGCSFTYGSELIDPKLNGVWDDTSESYVWDRHYKNEKYRQSHCWLGLLAKRFDCEYDNLAQPANSNMAIAQQVANYFLNTRNPSEPIVICIAWTERTRFSWYDEQWTHNGFVEKDWSGSCKEWVVKSTNNSHDMWTNNAKLMVNSVCKAWTFNKEYRVKKSRVNVVSGSVTETRVEVPDNIVYMDLSSTHTNASHDSVIRSDNGKRYLYDRENHTFNFDSDPEVDIIYEYDYIDLPKPIQDYVLARASAVFSSRLVGDQLQFQILKQAEAERKVNALEFDCNQGDFTFFGHPEGGNFYTSYQPYTALSRY